MTSGWRGNGTGNSGINMNSDGVSFTASGDGIGAVTDLAKPIQLEDAIIDMVVNVSPEFKASGTSLQIFAQIKGGDWAGEWNCWSGNELLTAGTDTAITCTISEGDKKFNQLDSDVQIGVQAKGTPTGTVTIKSGKVTLKQTASSSSSTGSVYSANVNSLRELADFTIGVAVSNNDSPTYNILTNASEKALVEKHFEQMTAGNIMKMSYLQNTQGNFTFANADAFVDYAKSKNMTVHGHALVWHAEYQVPAFMKSWSGSAADFITALETHITTVVDHFEAKGNLHSWDVVNEALTDGNPSTFRAVDSTFYIKSGNSAIYIEKAFLAARAAAPEATLYYNDYNIEQNGAKMTKLEEMLTDFKARNIPIDGVGFQMHVCQNYPSASSIAAAMKRVVDKGLKVKITELDVAINQPYCDSYPANKVSTFTQSIALAQKKRYCEIIKAYIDTVPAALRGGISVWGTTDANTWLNDLYRTEFNNEKISWPLLFDSNYNDKPALRGFADALQGVACTNL
ncbi:endo-1,4-beta-xylanase [Cellvibrio mixtus]|uniref:endo-1,4-beta-xylanase n=1 Tax=Cellvibrio mixtus TaxID=39650 RepID=UPI000B027C9C|nr:endo-1,4-beta-xylanase [Cellvibrio mixtus]